MRRSRREIVGDSEKKSETSVFFGEERTATSENSLRRKKEGRAERGERLEKKRSSTNNFKEKAGSFRDAKR